MSFPTGMGKIEFGQGKSLLFDLPAQQSGEYPTSRLQKGAVLVAGSQELAEEGLGFGVPLLKYGDLDVFPGSAKTSFNSSRSGSSIAVDYDLNFTQKLNWHGRKIQSPIVYRIEALCGRLHREHPLLREAGDRLFGPSKRFLGLKSVFEKGVSAGTIRVVYTLPASTKTIHIAVDLSGVKRHELTEIIIANEQGASYFVDYRDAKGSRLSGNGIGTWDEVIAEWASFDDSVNGIMFRVRKVNNARLFRGREFSLGVLAWSGLNYVLPPDTAAFNYDIELGAAQ